VDKPGPGQYETNVSSFKSVSIRKNKSIQPNHQSSHGASKTHWTSKVGIAHHKVSIPSIPSRYLTPVINMHGDKDENGQDVCKISRLVNDPTRVGPGTYEINNQISKKMISQTIDWATSTSLKSTVFHGSKATAPTVGPGAYNSKPEINRKTK